MNSNGYLWAAYLHQLAATSNTTKKSVETKSPTTGTYTRHAGVEKVLSFGMYPDVSVKLARARRDEARRKLAQKEDPGAERKAERDAHSNTLRALGLEWFDLQSNPPENSGRAALTAVTAKKTKWMLDAFLFPDLGDVWINDITPSTQCFVAWGIPARK